MPGVNYVYMVASLREQIQELFPLEENVVAVITKDRVIDDNFKRQDKKPNFVYL